MNLLIIPSWYPEGHNQNGIFFREQAEDLVSCGIKVIICSVSLSGKYPLSFTLHESVENGVSVFRAKKKNLTPFWEAGLQWQKIPLMEAVLSEIITKHGTPDIVHMESSRIVVPVSHLCRKHHLPWTFSEHFSSILLSSPGSYYDHVFKKATQQASHAFYISSVVKKRMDQYAMPSSHFSYVPNSIRFSAYRPKKLGNSHNFVFKALGSLVQIKRFDLLLYAMSEVTKKEPNIHLDIGGEGPERPRLQALIRKLKLEKKVTLCGRIERNDVPLFLSEASAFLCSSHFETFSVVTLEALAAGLPIIATDCGGPADLVLPSNGLLVPKDSVRALATAMLKMIHDINQYDAQTIHDEAKARFDSSLIAYRKLRIWKSLLSSSRANCRLIL